ncbi:LLM class flavin-dependent oxidoreductase [Inquilinus limosus]|uniref:LLM class flavin-dependent oxidoreductase n=1 Tax=Inquilinus limosus TaxID=171674 RepID=UPI000407FF6A|nr:LLM class flavin-dependent oxidoreductase [Inquilinus limosus]
MTIEIIGMIWARPTSDLETLPGPAVQPEFISRITRLHEEGGFDRVLAGYWTNAADGFLVAAHAGAAAPRIKLLLAHRPGFVAPTVAARKLATLDQLLGGRLALHVISGGDDEDQRKDGDYAGHDARYRRTDEYVEILRRVWTSDGPVSHHGAHYRFDSASPEVKPAQSPHPPIFFGGASEAAIAVAGRHADVYAFFGEPLADARKLIARVRASAARHGREIAFSWSNRPILGRTEKEAWEKARHLLERALAHKEGTAPETLIASSQAINAQRLVALAGRGEVLDERLWTPMALVLGGRGNSTALVGTPEQVARAMLRYREIGVSRYIIRGWDPLPDVAEYGRELVPLLKDLAANEGRTVVPFARRA